MAARSVFKLITKTCSYSFNPAYSSNISTVTPEKTLRKHNRSVSYSPRRHYSLRREKFLQLRNVSKSLENLREDRYKDEEYEYEVPDNEDPRLTLNRFPPPTDLSVRDPAKEFKEQYNQVEEVNDDGNPIYELAEGSRSQENYYDVNRRLRQLEADKARRLFLDLQPSSLKPYGSSHNFYLEEANKKPYEIVYPTFNATRLADTPKKKKPDDIHHKEFSSYAGNEQDTTKIPLAIFKPNERNRMKFSTIVLRKKRVRQDNVNSNSDRRSSTVYEKNVEDIVTKPNENENSERPKGAVDQLPQGMSDHRQPINRHHLARVISSKEALLQTVRSHSAGITRQYNTQSTPEGVVCEDYVTVKLGEMQEECRKEKKCKPKKISFGRLPKLSPPDCPCLEDMPLKEGKPLHRLKKRFHYGDVARDCTQILCDTPRADANYVVKPKKLPVIHPAECPCEETEMTDLVIKRLPKKEVLEPPRVCPPCVTEVCCPPRADGKIVVEQKVLPKLEPKDCPCLEDEPLKQVPLKKLNPLPVKERERKCVVEVCDVTRRADYGLKVEQKVLPVLKGECLCVEPPQMDEGEPLKRMKKNKVFEKPKVCKEEVCDVTMRADSKLKVGKKKLPTFIPRNCPCKEAEMPGGDVKLKRLPKFTIKEKQKICPVELCPPRADDGMVIKPKQLPVIEPKECPCVLTEMVEAPPLKKLVAKPVQERPRVCKPPTECGSIPRSDDNLKIKSKKLPVMPPGDCPCVEQPPPLDVKPLAKLKPKPIPPKKQCVIKVDECTQRADEHLKVKIKKLPRLAVPDCPCVELPPPEEGKPLRRLKKTHVPEPPRICKSEDICDETPRADEDDWLYWKRVEVKGADCDTLKKKKRKKNTRSSSTVPTRSYSTKVRPDYDLFNLQYEVPRLPPSTFKKQPHNIIIDIKPSAPLVLTQKQLEVNREESLEATMSKKKTRGSKSDPVDCVTFVIFKNNNLGISKPLKEGSSEASVFSTMNRFISTCSTFYDGHREAPHLQPRNPIIAEKEHFITPYPSDDEIEGSARKGRRYHRTRKDDKEEGMVVCKEEAEEETKPLEGDEKKETICDKTENRLTLWERVVNYFKARPNCPTPEEFRKIRLREEAERAAQAAGLCLYDPKELLRKSEKDLPKVITADTIREEECENR